MKDIDRISTWNRLREQAHELLNRATMDNPGSLYEAEGAILEMLEVRDASA